MVTLRCTNRLLARGRFARATRAPASSTVLGDWYANLLFTPRGQLILAVSERTLLPVLLPARDAKTLPQRLPEAVADVLRATGIGEGTIDRELGEMEPTTIAATANRRVLASMNDFAIMFNATAEHHPTLLAAALSLAKAPCGPLAMESPDDTTRAAFAESLH